MLQLAVLEVKTRHCVPATSSRFQLRITAKIQSYTAVFSLLFSSLLFPLPSQIKTTERRNFAAMNCYQYRSDSLPVVTSTDLTFTLSLAIAENDISYNICNQCLTIIKKFFYQ